MKAAKYVDENLKAYGFKKVKDFYVLNKILPNCKFLLTVSIGKDNSVKTTLIDPSLGEEYTLHLNPKSSGKFVGAIKCEYDEVLKDIVDKCTSKDSFVSPQVFEIMDYARAKYQSEVEYLWREKFDSHDGILRRKDTNKWYAALLTCKSKSLTGKDGGLLEVINLHMKNEDLEKLVDNNLYYRAFHMNKKSWISIILDGRVSIDEIFKRLDLSYDLATK